MKTEEIALSRVSENEANPREISQANFQKLVQSIIVFPRMLTLRPIVIDETFHALGGNMRLKALQHIVTMDEAGIQVKLDAEQRLSDDEQSALMEYWQGWQQQPTVTVVSASDLTEAQKQEFMIKDNLSFGNWDFKFSIITSDAEKARVIERGVESPQARLEAIERIANAGAGGATLRLRPFIIGVSTPTYLDLIKEAFNRGATALSTEFFCLETRSPTLRELLPTISKMAGFDILAFYKKYSVQSGYLRLNRKVKEPFFRNMKELCDQMGMRFYVSDAHFKELCHNGSCCGLPPTWNYSRGQMCEALNICKRKGYVRWSDIKLDAENLLRARLEKAMNLGTREKYSKYYTMSAADYMNWCWNNPQAAHSPYKMFEGAMVPADERDSEGNIVYKYNGAKF